MSDDPERLAALQQTPMDVGVLDAAWVDAQRSLLARELWEHGLRDQVFGLVHATPDLCPGRDSAWVITRFSSPLKDGSTPRDVADMLIALAVVNLIYRRVLLAVMPVANQPTAAPRPGGPRSGRRRHT